MKKKWSEGKMSEPVTVIGAHTVVNGNLEGDEDLTIEGRVEGTITLSRTLTIEQNGVVHANINVRNAIISGVLVGNVEAEDSVHVTEEGRVMGDIAAPRVILVDGASFRGNIDMGNFDVERGEVSERPVAMPAVRSTPEPAVTEAEELTLRHAYPLANRKLADIEREAILATLSCTGGNKTEAARRLGVTARTLSNKMKLWRRLGMVA